VPPNVISHIEPTGLVRVTINRPDKHNPLSLEVLQQIAAVLTAAAQEPHVRCAVIRGAGERYFAAGGDLRKLADVRTEEETTAMMEASRAALDAVRGFPLPVIALVNGDALGGGGELAVACDMRVFASHSRMAFVQGTLCISPAWGGGADLVRLLGGSRALRLLSTAELLDGPAALALGLADAVKAEAGGVDLDTLFIDEGFGTLDPETLEQVMSVIDDLRDGGRAVGIVSHVGDLKDRITERLEVRRPQPQGPSRTPVVA